MYSYENTTFTHSVLIEAKTKPHQPIRDEDANDSAKLIGLLVQSQKIVILP